LLFFILGKFILSNNFFSTLNALEIVFYLEYIHTVHHVYIKI